MVNIGKVFAFIVTMALYPYGLYLWIFANGYMMLMPAPGCESLVLFYNYAAVWYAAFMTGPFILVTCLYMIYGRDL